MPGGVHVDCRPAQVTFLQPPAHVYPSYPSQVHPSAASSGVAKAMPSTKAMPCSNARHHQRGMH